jgi:hypothetical protein
MSDDKKDYLQPTDTGLQVFSSEKNFELAQRMSRVFNNSSIVPPTYQGEQGMANCVIALEMANRMNISPLHVMQNLNIIYGNPSWSAKFLIACINTCGKFKTPLRYEFKGEENTDNWACRASAVDLFGEKLFGAWVSIGMAKKEGWYTKKSSKWTTMPELMLMYRAAAFFQRAYAPELSMGMYTSEEIIDMGRNAFPSHDIEYEEVEMEEAPIEDIPHASEVLTHEQPITDDTTSFKQITPEEMAKDLREGLALDDDF